ncbi:hypothetical protein KFU94_06145 [Chloroflexi bacterium TSY]|nr:hypothetical protein [Chloroflexi bacterium TSY]
MWISESGKVGIGTTRPETVLEVRSPDSDEIENLIVVRKDNQRGDGKQFFVQMQPAVPDVLLTTNGTGLHPSLSLGAGSSAKHMTIATSGNIGMGTANPNFPLEVNRDQITNDLVNIRTQGVNLWTIGKEGGIGASSLKALDKPILLAHPDETHGMALGPNVHWSDVATTGNLNLKGNVGIGTNSPQSALQVNGYTQLALTSGAPPSIDCNNATRGRMKVDSAAGLLYVCMDSGWVGK